VVYTTIVITEVPLVISMSINHTLNNNIDSNLLKNKGICTPMRQVAFENFL
jgi:hypothetical protein